MSVFCRRRTNNPKVSCKSVIKSRHCGKRDKVGKGKKGLLREFQRRCKPRNTAVKTQESRYLTGGGCPERAHHRHSLARYAMRPQSGSVPWKPSIKMQNHTVHIFIESTNSGDSHSETSELVIISLHCYGLLVLLGDICVL